MKFRKDESGSVTIEFVMWLPLVMALVVLAVDAAVAFVNIGHMWQTSRETARIVSRYGMTEAEAETWAAKNAVYGSMEPNVDVTVSGGSVQVSMATPMNELVVFGTLGFASDFNFTTRVRHAMEPL